MNSIVLFLYFGLYHKKLRNKLKSLLILLMILLVSCSDDKSTSPDIDDASYPILYENETNELFDAIINMRDTIGIDNYTKLENPRILVNGQVFNFYVYTNQENETYFDGKPMVKRVFETDSTITYLFKRIFYVENTNNLKDSIIRKRSTHFYTGVFEGNIFNRSELAINLVGRKNTVTTEAEYIGKDRVDVYFLVKEFLNEPIERDI